MIQDIAPVEFRNRYEPCAPAPDSRALLFRAGRLVCAYDAEKKALAFPQWRDMPPGTQAVYAFSLGGEAYFLVLSGQGEPEGYSPYTMGELRDLALDGNRHLFTAYSAYHLWKWYMSSRYCGRCGAKTALDREERAMVCPACGAKIYPRINPAVIVGVINGSQLLLTRYRTGFGHNALVAGFAEFGETLEETVQREVLEETGLHVTRIRYYKSQPWGVAADLLAGFFCDVAGDDTIRMDEGELKYAAWVRREEIVLQPNDYSLTNEMMRMFKEERIT